MTQWQQTLEVARWEFNRFVKWRQQFIGLGVMLVIGFASGFIGRAVAKSEAKTIRVAAVGGSALGFPLPTVSQIAWDTSRAWSERDVRTAVANDSLGGAILVRSSTQVDIVVRKRSGWTDPLERALNAARQQSTIASLVQSPQQLAALTTPITVSTSIVGSGAASVAKSTRIATVVIIGVGLTILLTGFGTLFIGITGEKTNRVTEQIVAMVRPQVWMDGKIIGLLGSATAGTGLLLIGVVVMLNVLPAALGNTGFTFPPIASDYGTLAIIVLVTLLGTTMWFSFMAALAATIDDPNSSTRSILLFVPMLPMGLAFTLIDKVDSTAAQLLSIVPVTSMAVLPMRLVLTTVPWWEIVLSISVLVGAVYLFRTVAGKVFGTAVLMYGKEPSLAEVWRWIRA